jgi:hypothetical protein
MQVGFFEYARDEDGPRLELSPRPGAEPPAAADAARVGVLFRPPSPGRKPAPDDPLEYEFAIDEANLAWRMERAVREVYAIFGSEGLDAFGRQLPVARRTGGAPAGGVTERSDDDNAVSLHEAFDRRRKALEERMQPALRTVERLAAEIALARVREAATVVETERQRYLGEKASIYGPPDRQTIRGPGGEMLAWALLKLHPLRADAKAARSNADRAKVSANILAVSPRASTTLFDARGLPRSMRQSAIDAYRIARDTLLQKQTVYLKALAGLSVGVPVLARIAEVDAIIDEVAAVVEAHETEDHRTAALMGAPALRAEVMEKLRIVHEANGRIRERIERLLAGENGKFDVWRYPPLIEGALEQLGVPQQTPEWRAAVERQGEAKTSTLSQVSMGCGLFEMSVSAVGRLPGLAAAASLIGLFLDIADMVRDIWLAEEDADAFNAAVNPADTFAAEPSAVSLWSIGSILLQLTMLGKTKRDLMGP